MAFLVIVMNHCGRSCKVVDRECQTRLTLKVQGTDSLLDWRTKDFLHQQLNDLNTCARIGRQL